MKVLYWSMILIVIGVSIISFIGEETDSQLLLDIAYSGIPTTMFFLIYVFLSGWAVYLFSRKIYLIAMNSSSPMDQPDFERKKSVLSQQQFQYTSMGSKYGAYTFTKL